MHHIDLGTINLKTGNHTEAGPDTVCLLEAVAWFAGEKHSDHPTCVSPVLGAFGRAFNDGLGDEQRQRLVPLIPRLVGTAGDPEADEVRAWMATDWLVRTFTVTWLRKAGLTVRADELAALPELTSTELVTAALATIETARKEADATRAAAAAAGAATRDAAGVAAGAATRDAAAAAGDATRDAAGDVAGDVAWAAAGDVAWAAAKRKEGYSAQYDAAYKAARALFDVALGATTAELTESAFELFGRMIDVRTAVLS